MVRFRRRLRFSSSPAVFRRAIVVGCAVFLVAWHFLPNSPAGRVVTVCLPAIAGQSVADDGDANEPSVRRWIVQVGSPQLKKLKAFAAETHRSNRRQMPLEYYAEQWRITAAEYYYERDVQRNRGLAAAGGAGVKPAAKSKPSAESQRLTSLPQRTVAGGTAAVVPVSLDVLSERPATPEVFGPSYWQRERRRAEARQQALLMSLPAPAALGQEASITFGELIPGRPQASWIVSAAVAAVLAALGTWWLQKVAVPSVAPADKRPLMQLVLPSDWIRQAPSLGQRLVRTVVTAAWVGILGSFAAAWLR